MYRADPVGADPHPDPPNPNRRPNFAFTIVSPRALTAPVSFASCPLSTDQPTTSATGATDQRSFWKTVKADPTPYRSTLPVKSLCLATGIWSRTSPNICNFGPTCRSHRTPGSTHQFLVPSPCEADPVGAIPRTCTDSARSAQLIRAYLTPKLTSPIPDVFAFCSGLRKRTGTSVKNDSFGDTAYSK